MRVLGIDPGLHTVGYGLISPRGREFCAEEFGTFQTEANKPFAERLKSIHESMSGLLEKLAPDHVAVEETYITQNAKTSLRLGHTRGVILLAVIQGGLTAAEYAPREIKKAVVGNGAASKQQVQWMVAQMLNLRIDTLSEDAADGLAVALCHGLRNRLADI